MAGTGAGVVRPGWWAAYALPVACLWLYLLLLTACAAETTEAMCGRPALTAKIMGGQKAADQRWPWQASLLYKGRHICGATLINAFWVLSAAHCFRLSSNPSDYKILLGYHKLRQPTKHSLQITVYRLIVHSEFNKYTFMGSDIALLQLHLSVNFTSHILPVCLPGPNITLTPLASCWITGWGMITESDFLAPPLQLQEAEVGVIDNKVCKSFFQSPDPRSKKYAVQDDMLCAGDLLTGKSVCQGDSGGPLVCELNSTWFLLGLASWSLPCIQPIGPSIFTRVSYYSSWISEQQNASPNPNPSSAPPQGSPPALGHFSSLGTVHKPMSLTTLAFLQTIPLLLISFKAL